MQSDWHLSHNEYNADACLSNIRTGFSSNINQMLEICGRIGCMETNTIGNRMRMAMTLERTTKRFSSSNWLKLDISLIREGIEWIRTDGAHIQRSRGRTGTYIRVSKLSFPFDTMRY